MKTITTSVLLSLLMITSAACSSTSTEDLTSKKEQEIATRKAEVEALAKEYGVSVFINEEIWAQRVPSYEEVEVYFESIKSRKSGLSVSETTSSTDATIAKASTSLEYKPTRVKRMGENNEPFDVTLYFRDAYVNGFNINLTANWHYGGRFSASSMSISAEAWTFDSGDLYTSVSNISFVGVGSPGSFSAQCRVSCSSNSTTSGSADVFGAFMQYDHNTGICTYTISDSIIW